jgi:integrase
MPNPPKLLTVGSESLTYYQWSARPPHVPVTTICSRLKLGWSPEEAVSIPVDRRFRPTVKHVKGVARPCPKLRVLKASQQAYCEWVTNGQRNVQYFGKAGKEETERKYAKFQMEWATRLVRPVGPKPGEIVLVCELVKAWLHYCENGDDGEGGYLKHGKLTSGIHAQRAAMNYLMVSHSKKLVDEFGPDDLRAVRRGMIETNLARQTINGYQTAIVQMFGWGVGRKLVAAEVWQTLKHVGRLQKGKTTARDNPKRRAVAWADVEATFPHLHTFPDRRAVLESLIRVHWFLGGRPQDLVRMQVGDIDRTSDVWHYVVESHKNEHRDQEHPGYYIGPRCQAILAPLLEGKQPSDFVFTYPVGKGGQPKPIQRGVYGNRVKAACKKAKIKAWTPHQLRKSRATEVMRIYESNEAAAAVIGDTPEVTEEIYVDPFTAVRKRIARETG